MESNSAGRASRDDRGAVIVEFALIVPILLVLLVGILNFGLLYNTQIALQGVAREGARALALDNSAVDAVRDASENGGVAMSVSSQTSCSAGDSDAYASVTTTADFTFSIPFLNLGTKTVTATASMRCGL